MLSESGHFDRKPLRCSRLLATAVNPIGHAHSQHTLSLFNRK